MAKPKTKLIDNEDNNLINNPNIENNWIDMVAIQTRNDSVCLLRFYTNLPEGSVEKVRVVMSRDHLKRFASSINTVISEAEKMEKEELEKL